MVPVRPKKSRLLLKSQGSAHRLLDFLTTAQKVKAQPTVAQTLPSCQWGLKNPHNRGWMGHCFQIIFDNSRLGKQWQSTVLIFAPWLNNCYNHSHAPGSHSPSPWPDSKCSKTVEVGYIVKTLSAQDHYWQNPRKKNYRESSNIKALVSVHWRAHCHAKWPRGCRGFQHPAGIKPMLPASLLLTLNAEP